MKFILVQCMLLSVVMIGNSQPLLTTFEKSNGYKTTTYFDAIQFYTHLSKQYKGFKLQEIGTTDAGFPLHVCLYSSDNQFDMSACHQRNKLIVFINNGIHPGEPDGIDATMLFMKEIANKKITIPSNVLIAVIPVYNIGGALNRNKFSRVNQNGPEEYGFRGNAQNLDLNRDFTKCNTAEAITFSKIFHWLHPHIFIDTHVSDGADYQHTMTLLNTHHQKLAGNAGVFLHDNFLPALYREMKNKQWSMIPYVNFESGNPQDGWEAFYDSPRYSTGYASLFGTMGFMPETHMLKPFKDRVHATLDLLKTVIRVGAENATAIIQNKNLDEKKIAQQESFVMKWQVDSTRFDIYPFMGYEIDTITSSVTGLPRIKYNHSKPYTKNVKLYNYLLPTLSIKKPKAYVIPQGWYKVIELLKNNGITVKQLKKDTLITAETYYIDKFNTSSNPIEGHYKHSNTIVRKIMIPQHFLKGDFLIETGKSTDRFLVEMLEPENDDSYFAWNYFDAVLQQKEGYSNYRWEDIADDWLNKNPALKTSFEAKKNADNSFKLSADAQLYYIYQQSPYYEPVHNRYPVFRLLN